MISVIIPVYNVEDYLDICLNSVLMQSYQNFEVICVDDASTDNSLEILKYYQRKDSRIKIITNDYNMGPGYSRNRGLDFAQGKYISFLDGDDWFSVDAFEILVEKFEKEKLDLLIFKNIVYYEDSQHFRMEDYYNMSFMNQWESKIFNHWDLDKTKLFSVPNAPWNKFYLKSFLDQYNIRFPNENLIHEDNPFFYKVFTSANRIAILNKYLYTRRRRPNSIMTLTNERLFDNIDIIYHILNVFLVQRDLYDYYKKEVLEYIFSVISKGKYNKIDEKFKKRFFNEIQVVLQRFVKEYGLYEDIKLNVDEKILNFFNFENAVQDFINYYPKISIIIPVYNVDNYLEVCLDSVCNQSFKDFEIICINDGSTDDSLSILKKYWKADSRFTLISQDNKGLSAARNAGLKVAKGDYIYFLDSDDYIKNEALQEMYKISQEKNLDMLLFKTCCFHDETNERFIDEYFEMNFLRDLVNEIVFNYKDINQRVYDLATTMGSTFFKHDLILDLKFEGDLIFEDDPFFIEAIFNANRVFFLEKYLYHKRVTSITNNTPHNFSDIIEIRNIIIDLAKKYNNFHGMLYAKKLNLIKFRFSQTSEEFKGDFFEKIQKDFIEHKEEYESSNDFKELPEDIRLIFYEGLNSNDYEEFENNINLS